MKAYNINGTAIPTYTILAQVKIPSMPFIASLLFVLFVQVSLHVRGELVFVTRSEKAIARVLLLGQLKYT